MKKITIIAPIHKWDDIRVLKKEAVSLQEEGYIVTLYAKTERNFLFKGINVKSITKQKISLKERIHLQKKMYDLVKKNESDLYHFHNPDTLLIALFVKKFLKKKVIYDTHEDFSKRILMREWIPTILKYPIAKSIEKIESFACQYLDKVIVTQKELQKKYKNKSLLLLNPPILNQESYNESLIFSRKLKLKKAFRFIYIGGISKTRGIEEFLNAYGKLVEKYPEIDCEFILIGPIMREYLEELIQHHYWKLVDFKGELPQEEAFGYLINSDVGICTILDVGDHKNTSANKIYEYQRFGKPFIATDFPLWKEELSSIGSGIFVNPLNEGEVLSSLETLVHNKELRINMGANGQKYIFENFNWSLEKEKLLNLYKEIIK